MVELIVTAPASTPLFFAAKFDAIGSVDINWGDEVFDEMVPKQTPFEVQGTGTWHGYLRGVR